MIDDREMATHVFAALERLRRRADADMHRVVPADLRGLRGSHGRLLDLIARDGSRPSDLAEGAWITKQAVSQRLREMEERGWVSLDADPADGRAVIVRRTAAGTRVHRRARRAIASMEEEWADQVGAHRYAEFRRVLDELGRIEGTP